jgi:hypothetical protein
MNNKQIANEKAISKEQIFCTSEKCHCKYFLKYAWEITALLFSRKLTFRVWIVRERTVILQKVSRIPSHSEGSFSQIPKL